MWLRGDEDGAALSCRLHQKLLSMHIFNLLDGARLGRPHRSNSPPPLKSRSCCKAAAGQRRCSSRVLLQKSILLTIIRLRGHMMAVQQSQSWKDFYKLSERSVSSKVHPSLLGILFISAAPCPYHYPRAVLPGALNASPRQICPSSEMPLAPNKYYHKQTPIRRKITPDYD